MSSIYEEIKQRRQYQDAKWGGPAHDDAHTPSDWWSLITAYNRMAFGRGINGLPSAARDKLLDVAALAVAAIEAIDRKEVSGD